MRALLSCALLAALVMTLSAQAAPERPRAREAGLRVGILEPGPLNAITDVEGVAVGHLTLIEGASVRTGVTGHRFDRNFGLQGWQGQGTADSSLPPL